ncbi:MAG TPA: phosphoribosylformylglycinamidine cyclo-ligase, partial [Bacteroidetes bacterium]|nr:phosphoribosylformylglycinamidine cyclo-ligase [Bacteroidota bacterium]
SVWKGIAQDSIVMNLDDLLCVGAAGPFIFSSVINRNKNLIPGEVLQQIIEGNQLFFDEMKKHGVEIGYLGGETADMGDVIRTVSVDSTIACRMKRSNVIEINLQPGDVIVGLASYGKAIYETEYNSGIGSNGLTAARHDVLSKFYAEEYPESFDTDLPHKIVFTGSKRLTDTVEGSELNAGKLLLSPTRTFAPVILEVLKKYSLLPSPLERGSEVGEDKQRSENPIHGIVHNSGGGQKKVMHFNKSVHVIKDNLFPTPTVFKLIQQESKTPWSEMYQVFNMGTRMEIYCKAEAADEIISISKSFGVEAQIIGRCEASAQPKLTIESEFGKFEY